MFLSFDYLLIEEVLTSAVFILILGGLRYVLIHFTKRGNSDILSKDQRRWIARIKATSLIFLAIGLFFIWGPQLENLALSLMAVALALVVALKEVILGITAGFVRVTTTPFRVGDWILLDGHTGEVFDIDAFAIRMQEIEQTDLSYQYTGRTIVIPNSKIFTSNIINLQETRSHIFHDVRVVVAVQDIEPQAVLDQFRASVDKHYAPFIDQARKILRKTEKRTGVRLGASEPLTSLQTLDSGNLVLFARVFLPVEDVIRISSIISEETLIAAYESRAKRQRGMLKYEQDLKVSASDPLVPVAVSEAA